MCNIVSAAVHGFLEKVSIIKTLKNNKNISILWHFCKNDLSNIFKYARIN